MYQNCREQSHREIEGLQGSPREDGSLSSNCRGAAEIALWSDWSISQRETTDLRSWPVSVIRFRCLRSHDQEPTPGRCVVFGTQQGRPFLLTASYYPGRLSDAREVVTEAIHWRGGGGVDGGGTWGEGRGRRDTDRRTDDHDMGGVTLFSSIFKDFRGIFLKNKNKNIN